MDHSRENSLPVQPLFKGPATLLVMEWQASVCLRAELEKHGMHTEGPFFDGPEDVQGHNPSEQHENDPAALAERAVRLLKNHHVPRSPLIVLLPESVFTHETIEIPNLQGSSLQDFAEHREEMATARLGSPRAWRLQVLSRSAGLSGDRMRILAAEADRSFIRKLYQEMKKRGMKPAFMGSPVSAFVNLIQATQSEELHRPTLAVLLAARRAFFLVFTEGELEQIRLLDRKYLGHGSNAAALATEVRRTSAFYRELHRGREIEHVLVFDPWSEDGGLALTREIPSTISLRPETSGQTTGNAAALLSLLALSIDTRRKGHTTIDFLPARSKAQTAAIAAGGLALVTVALLLSAASVLDSKARAGESYATWLGIEANKLSAAADSLEHMGPLLDKCRQVCKLDSVLVMQRPDARAGEAVSKILELLPAEFELRSIHYSSVDSESRLVASIEGAFAGRGAQQLANFLLTLGRLWPQVMIRHTTSGVRLYSTGEMNEQVDIVLEFPSTTKKPPREDDPDPSETGYDKDPDEG